ncbi:hypothetical protein RM530_12865 [Algiphilus sp. W345]|uniref:Uncharacterized protein n=1 Tax=Banduia mediterranea TaxID=3075609 RepID=A0ABU2WL53_9GAMM|nr:hypothetical protein [Algiphilus sp. W345]MDT0498250.1 hypothetical protein [Algiphilus sp. W345]
MGSRPRFNTSLYARCSAARSSARPVPPGRSIRNSGYEVSLEPRKLYEVLPDPAAAKQGQVRVVDESGEDYLYPVTLFVDAQLPNSVAEQVANAA